MIWIIIVIACLIAVAIVLNLSGNKKSVPTKSEKYVERNGRLKKADAVFEAWTSGDLSKMLSQLSVKTNLVDRHFLLMNIVKETYRNRQSPNLRRTMLQVAQMHIDEFQKIKPALIQSTGCLPRVPTFQQYATVLSEDGNYHKAIEVCQLALKYGLHDGTKGGFEARIAKIRKKMKIESKKIPNHS